VCPKRRTLITFLPVYIPTIHKKTAEKFGGFGKSSYICKENTDCDNMTKQEMIQQIADYFKTQPVLKVWIFGSFSRGEVREDCDVDIL